jgi:hypothetical protein
VRRIAGNLFIDYRTPVDVVTPVVLVVVYVLVASSHGFATTLAVGTRSALYGSLAATTGALLGFVLTALAILVALPSSERVEALRRHPRWDRVPSAYFRAAWALLTALILCTLGIAIDGGSVPAKLYEGLAVAAIALALVRVAGAVVALDAVMRVARTPDRTPIQDPGP